MSNISKSLISQPVNSSQSLCQLVGAGVTVTTAVIAAVAVTAAAVIVSKFV